MSEKLTVSGRKSKRSQALRKGESQHCNGGYQYRWTDSNGKRHSSKDTLISYCAKPWSVRRVSEKILGDVKQPSNPVFQETVKGGENR